MQNMNPPISQYAGDIQFANYTARIELFMTLRIDSYFIPGTQTFHASVSIMSIMNFFHNIKEKKA